MNQFDHHWQKLTALAREAGNTRDAAAPYGFSTRVAAQAARAPAAAPWAVFERLALRGLLAAAALGVGAIALNFSTILNETGDEYAAADSVSEILDLS